MLKRLLIISASVGAGHVAAAKALEQQAKQEGIITQHIDLLDKTSPLFRQTYRNAYFEFVKKTPDLVNFVGNLLDRKPSENKTWQHRVMVRLSRVLIRRTVKQIKVFNLT